MSEWSPPPHRSVPWTLCASLAALSSCGGAEESAGNGPTPQPWWRAGEGAAALVFEPQSALSGRWLLPEIMGGGVAILDADGDGRLDVLLVNPRGDHGLFLGRDGGFADASAPAGLDQSLEGTAMGVACGDVDNDGDVDLYLTRHGPDRLLRNRGDGTFEDATEAFGVAVGGWSASAAFADYDGDGFLDLFVTQYVAFDAERECRGWSGRRDFCGPKEFPPLADVLLHNEGGAGFRDVSVEAGISGVACAGLGVVWEDVDRDGLVDLYVANDAYPNQCWRNEGDGSFRDVAHELGIALNLDGRPEAGMGIAAEDFCGDGRTDLFVTHLRAETNTLYRRRPNGEVFGDATGPSRLGGRSMPFTGFGVCALDVELDGDLDLFVANGARELGRARDRSDSRRAVARLRRGEPVLPQRRRGPLRSRTRARRRLHRSGRGLPRPRPRRSRRRRRRGPGPREPRGGTARALQRGPARGRVALGALPRRGPR
ncbi:MAG: VCBS repeat-containing protein [Planctomycetota bacterium]|jgi:hypothetical protein|nr:VCBS repeat-containing protein [Planctomycetota bacterium]